MALHDFLPRPDPLTFQEPAEVGCDQNATVDRVLAIVVPPASLGLESLDRRSEESLQDSMKLGTNVLAGLDHLDCSSDGVRGLACRVRYPLEEISKRRCVRKIPDHVTADGNEVVTRRLPEGLSRGVIQ